MKQLRKPKRSEAALKAIQRLASSRGTKKRRRGCPKEPGILQAVGNFPEPQFFVKKKLDFCFIVFLLFFFRKQNFSPPKKNTIHRICLQNQAAFGMEG